MIERLGGRYVIDVKMDMPEDGAARHAAPALAARGFQQIFDIEVADYKFGYYISVTPLVVKDRLIMGMSNDQSDIPGFLEGAHVSGDVTIGHVEGVPDFSEGKLRGGGQERHDTKASFFVDHAIQLKKWFRVHAVSLCFSVK